MTITMLAGYLVIINAAALLVMAEDKRRAKRHQWRVPVLLIRCNRFPPDNALIISVPRRKVCCQNHKVKTFLAPMQKHSVVFYEKNTKCIVRDRLQTGAAGLILKPTGGVIHESIRNTHLH